MPLAVSCRCFLLSVSSDAPVSTLLRFVQHSICTIQLSNMSCCTRTLHDASFCMVSWGGRSKSVQTCCLKCSLQALLFPVVTLLIHFGHTSPLFDSNLLKLHCNTDQCDEAVTSLTAQFRLGLTSCVVYSLVGVAFLYLLLAFSVNVKGSSCMRTHK